MIIDTNWEKYYKKRGQIQSKVTEIVKNSITFLKKDSKILDIGCGTGRHSIFLAKKGFDVIAIDPSKTGLEIAKKKAEKLKINFKVGKKEKINFENNYFDAVIITNVLSHSLISDIKKSVKEINRVLKKGGFVILTDLTTKREDYGIGNQIEPNTFTDIPKHMDSTPHHFFTEDEILTLFNDFKVLKKYYTKEGRQKGQINLILMKK